MRRVIYLSWILIVFCFETLQAQVVRLKPGDSIQKAIDKAAGGDTLFLSDGIYREHEIIIRKPLVIIGANHPLIDGEGQGNIFIVAADQVHFRNLKLANTGKSNMDDSAGIKFFDSNYCSVENLILEQTFFGLHFSNSTNITVKNNRLISEEERETSTGNGIHFWKSSQNHIEGNYIKGHRDGIYLEFATQTVSKSNIVEYNKRYGLHFMFSHDNSYLENIFRRNGAGVAVMYTRNVKMIDNIFELNEGVSAYGILLKDISDSEVRGNIFRDNTIGIYMEGSSRSQFVNNTFQNNGWALKLMASNDANSFLNNNFIRNTFDISTNGNLVLNTLEGNYWDKYEGYDIDKDGIGDIPYRPISLYSVIVEKIPSAVILWRSFMVTLLDRMEKVIPSITPENMADPSPRMKPYDFHKKNI
jgi:nitrous oxidase accessory protein